MGGNLYNFKTPEDTGISPIELLYSIDQLEVYNWYLPEINDIRKKYYSPFKEERTPSFSLYEEGGILKFKDFSSGYGGDCINLIKHLERCDTKIAMGMIVNKLRPVAITRANVGKKVESKMSNGAKSDIEIQVVLRDLNEDDLELWKPISQKALEWYDVKACEEVWINYGEGLKLWAKHRHSNPIYRYKWKGRYKIYRPKEINKKRKWISNTRYYDIQGWDQLPDSGPLLFITKSYKDVMTLRLMGFIAVAPQAESNTIRKGMVDHLKKRFDQIILFYDNDERGKELSEKARRDTGLKSIEFPPWEFVKDPFELAHISGTGYTKNAIQLLINKIDD